jgi:hypothetical protein
MVRDGGGGGGDGGGGGGLHSAADIIEHFFSQSKFVIPLVVSGIPTIPRKLPLSPHCIVQVPHRGEIRSLIQNLTEESRTFRWMHIFSLGIY